MIHLLTRSSRLLSLFSSPSPFVQTSIPYHAPLVGALPPQCLQNYIHKDSQSSYLICIPIYQIHYQNHILLTTWVLGSWRTTCHQGMGLEWMPHFRLSPVHSLSLAPATSALASTLAPAAPVHRLQQATASGYSTRGPIRSRHSLSPLALAREDAIANASPRSRLPIAGR
jgi:hypothetical protein